MILCPIYVTNVKQHLDEHPTAAAYAIPKLQRPVLYTLEKLLTLH